MASRFEFDPEFDDNLLHWRGSLNPIGDTFRRVADKIRTSARNQARTELAFAQSQMASSSSGKWGKRSGRNRYLKAKALAYSMNRYIELIYAAEVHGADENYAIVSSGHAAALAIEFGGYDAVIKAGEEPLEYPAMGILRRSI
jgi:hypothetical protein